MSNDDEELHAWARMLRRAPPSIRSDLELHRAYILAAGRRIAGAERAAARAVEVAGEYLPLRERTVAIAGAVGYGTYILIGLGVLGAVAVGVMLWRRRTRSTTVGLDALGAVDGYEVLAASG